LSILFRILPTKLFVEVVQELPEYDRVNVFSKLVKQVARICRAFTLGDWFLLYQLGKNIDPIIFREFLDDLHEELRRKDAEKNAQVTY
jgi:hypothetical protein